MAKRKGREKAKRKEEGTRAHRVGQVQIAFTNKRLAAWGGACSVVAKFLERLRFREWALERAPMEETSPNAKGIYEKALALLLTSPTGGTRFRHVAWWSHGMEGLKSCDVICRESSHPWADTLMSPCATNAAILFSVSLMKTGCHSAKGPQYGFNAAAGGHVVECRSFARRGGNSAGRIRG